MTSMSECVFGSDWEEPSHVLFDARYIKRASAIGYVASEYSLDFQDARCRTRYARWLTDQEIWDLGAGERWWDDQGELDPVTGKWVFPNDGLDRPPSEPVEGWEPGEMDPAWDFCGKGDDGAIKVYEIETGL